MFTQVSPHLSRSYADRLNLQPLVAACRQYTEDNLDLITTCLSTRKLQTLLSSKQSLAFS